MVNLKKKKKKRVYEPSIFPTMGRGIVFLTSRKKRKSQLGARWKRGSSPLLRDFLLIFYNKQFISIIFIILNKFYFKILKYIKYKIFLINIKISLYCIYVYILIFDNIKNK